MKKFLIVMLILVSGAGLLGSLRFESERLNQKLSATLDSSRAQTTELEAARQQREALQKQVRQLRDQSLRARTTAASSGESLEAAVNLALANQPLSPEQREQLLAALGFNWNTSGDYLIVSKETLRHVGLDGMKGPKLTDAVCGVLAISPSERAAIETTAQQIFADYATWMKANVERREPQDDMICEYKVNLDPAYTQSASNLFTAQIAATLGEERAELFRSYAENWMNSLGMLGAEPATLTINQYNKNEAQYLYTIKFTHSAMTTEISPWQPFPETFLPLFPNGWEDLARAEGFELPKEFEQHKAR